MPNTVIYANILPFIALVFVMIFMRINPLFNRRQNKLFFISASIITFMLTVISVDYTVSLLEGFDKGYIIRTISSFFNFSLSCTVPIFLIAIFTNKKIKPILFLPAVINIIICFASIFTNLVFDFSENGDYNRGPLFFVPSLITVFYIVILLIASIKRRFKRPLEALFLIGTIIGLNLALYLEVVKRFKFLSWDFAAVFLILYYLLLNINKSKYDQLTGANNRSMYVQKTEGFNHSHRCIIAMIDINGFKTINDEKGHEEGDKLLVKFVATANSFMDKKNVLYRIGGDEFAVISEEESLEKFKNLMKDFFSKLQEYDINCAVGFEEYDPSVDIENAIHKADMKMYEDKRKFYSEKAQI